MVVAASSVIVVALTATSSIVVLLLSLSWPILATEVHGTNHWISQIWILFDQSLVNLSFEFAAIGQHSHISLHGVEHLREQGFFAYHQAFLNYIIAELVAQQSVHITALIDHDSTYYLLVGFVRVILEALLNDI